MHFVGSKPSNQRSNAGNPTQPTELHSAPSPPTHETLRGCHGKDLPVLGADLQIAAVKVRISGRCNEVRTSQTVRWYQYPIGDDSSLLQDFTSSARCETNEALRKQPGRMPQCQYPMALHSNHTPPSHTLHPISKPSHVLNFSDFYLNYLQLNNSNWMMPICLSLCFLFRCRICHKTSTSTLSGALPPQNGTWPQGHQNCVIGPAWSPAELRVQTGWFIIQIQSGSCIPGRKWMQQIHNLRCLWTNNHISKEDGVPEHLNLKDVVKRRSV